MNKTSIKRIIVTALFSALIAAGSFIRIPLPPVPVTLQTLFTLICGLLLPAKLSITSVGIYLFSGLIGLPVFTSGGGLIAFAGPTGGYLAGLLPAVAVLSAFRRKNNFFLNLFACLLATVTLYVPGLFWLKHSLHLSWKATFAAGLLPFVPGDSIKIVVSALVGKNLREKTDNLLTDCSLTDGFDSSESSSADQGI